MIKIMNILKLSSPGKIWFGFYVVVIILLLIFVKEKDQSTMNVVIWLILLLTKLQYSTYITAWNPPSCRCSVMSKYFNVFLFQTFYQVFINDILDSNYFFMCKFFAFS